MKIQQKEVSEVINFATVYFPSVPETTRTNGTVNRVITVTDNIAPTTTASLSPSPKQAGWNNTDVTVNLASADNTDGSGVREIHYNLTGAETREAMVSADTIQVSITTEGTTTLSYWAVDSIGNIEIAKSLIVKIDKTPPTISYQTSPQPNSYGWNNIDVTVIFTAIDVLSGVATVSDPITVTREGANQYIGGEATDYAGNRATAFTTLNIDKTPPQVSIYTDKGQLITLIWPPNHKMIDITIGGVAIDNLSGIVQTAFNVDDEYNTIEPQITGFNTTIQLEAWRDGEDYDGRHYTLSVTAIDKANNNSSASTEIICPHDQGG